MTAQQCIEKRILDLNTQLKVFQQASISTIGRVGAEELYSDAQALNTCEVTLKVVMLVAQLPEKKVFLAACSSTQSSLEQYRKQAFLPMLDSLTISSSWSGKGEPS
uniref:Uncharacterized protein n=1 Tax=Thermosporothrix sp. COM3 TaxID=2490863 RepID=A0A455SJH9_9CHLR|nr:hypothetical protein KTC_18600 [Thermosporothrix sp. COM3]